MSDDRLLFTPGPLTTSRTVKEAMLRDIGSREPDFIEIVREIRQNLLSIAGAAGEYEAVLMQGSGTFGLESVLGSAIPESGKLLVIVNGAYGERMLQIAERLQISASALRYPEDSLPSHDDLRSALKTDDGVTHIALVHCETTSGILNPLDEIGKIARDHGRQFVVDAMSSFGGIPIDVQASNIDFLISSANKCLEGVPGFSFVIARRESLLRCEHARSLSMDLLGQWRGLESTGQFRFTPPTHALLAFAQALHELEQEGGVDARAARYRANHETLIDGMRALGFNEVLRPELQSYIITAFGYPNRFDFAQFYERLCQLGYILYPGKLGSIESFRIGTIGRIFPEDIKRLLAAIRQTLDEMARNCLAAERNIS
jgi:2-aminoethylphosphonate-pyruvate transaminase